MNKGKIIFFLICIINLTGFFVMNTPAAEEIGGEGLPGEEALSDYDFSQIESFLKSSQEAETVPFSFTDMLLLLMQGDVSKMLEQAGQSFRQALAGGVGNNGKLLLQMIILGLSGAIFTNFSSIFTSSSISETGFFAIYMLMFTFLAASFFASITLAGQAVEALLEFMKVLMPSYFLAVAFAGGSASSLVLYESMFLAVTLVEWLVARILIPLMKIYFLCSLAGHMAKENMLSRLTDLIRTVVSWSMKTVMGIVLGLNVIQGMILPYVDAVKNSTLEKALEAVPVVGKGAGVVTKMVLGSGILIKNTMGVAAVIILAAMILIPVIKLLLLAFIYQCAAAAMEPVCDKRLVSCLGAVAEGHKILIRLVVSSFALFVLVIAVVCSATNATYFSG